MSGNMRGASGNVNDGFYDIKFLYDGVFLTVYPPMGKGKRVEARDIIDRLNRKQIRGLSRERIEFAASKADKMPVRIAEAQEEKKLNSSATVMVTPDKMKAFITISPPDGGRPLTAEELSGILRQNGVIHGIKQDMLDILAKSPVYNDMVCAAEGTPPVNGQNGRVEFHFNIAREKRPSILEDGRVDFRELNIIESVKKGQVLCSLVAPLPGEKGRTVTGGEMPAAGGKPAVLPRGRNVEAVADGQQLASIIDGQVSYIDGKVNVFATYEVPADVDNSTGNIYFVGNVIVRGNVLTGFTVEAGGSVEVWGVVEGAVIKAAGDIVLRRGMQGMGKGSLISGGDIVAKYIENSSVEARNDIKAEAIMHSSVKCGNRLELSGRKGLLVGGTCKVGKEVSAKVIGSYMATSTEVEVGVDPTLRERYKILREEVSNMENDLRKADQAIALLKKLEAAGALTPDKQEIMAKSLRTKLYFSSKISELKEEMNAIEGKLQQEAFGRVRAYNYIYPGTKVAIGSCMMHVRENLQYCTLYRDGADVRVGAIDR